MTHGLVAIAFVAIPLVAWIIKRSLAWVAAALIAGGSIAGAVVSVADARGYRWTWTSLELLTLATFVVVLVAAWLTRPREEDRRSIRPQFLAIGIPILVVAIGILLSRLVAAPSSGLFTGVGFFMRRIYAEDNAKWLDFTSRMVQGGGIEQSDPLGGPLQVFLIPVADVLSAVSIAFLGGLNEVFVMTNTVIYGQYALVILGAIALAPLAERVFTSPQGERGLPAGLIWVGAAIVVIGSLAASGLGHLTLQFTFIVAGFWVAAHLVDSPRTIRSLASLSMVPLFLVWFPMAPVSAVVVVVAVITGIALIVRRRDTVPWVLVGLWIVTIALVASELLWVLQFLGNNASVGAVATAGGAVGGVAAGVAANAMNLNLLASQGGTEEATAITGGIALAAALGAALFLGRNTTTGGMRTWVRYGPVLVLALYAGALSFVGSWWAGEGPNYGAVKTTFLVTFVIAGATVPLALRLIDANSLRTTAPQWVAIGGVLFLLTIDGVAPRAAIYASPQQWPSVIGEDRGYWWPAEVKTQAEQPISSLPVACAFWFDSTKAPTVIPDGQPMYACTRILAGMNGADYEALPLVNWARREWFTNEPAWDPEYPNLLTVPDDLRSRDFILLDFNKQVIGLEKMTTLMDRFKPPWAYESE